MSQNTQNQGAFTPKRIRRAIKMDRLQASDFRQLDIIYCCEQCSFYCPNNKECLMGMPTEPHRQEEQLKTFNLTGHMAFCRFLEID